MTDPQAAGVIDLLIQQAWNDHAAGRYASGISAAGRAVRAAEQADNANLLIQALVIEASVLKMQGEYAASLVRYTQVLGMAQDPAITAQLDKSGIWAVGKAYIMWTEAARFAGGIGVRELFDVLDAAERWMTAVGHREWRDGLLLERAMIHKHLFELDAAVAAAQESLAVWDPGSPGYTLAAHRYQLGNILRAAGRPGEAEPLYHSILDDDDVTPRDRTVALQGLAWCALEADDPAAAVRHGTAAVEVAETLGGGATVTALEALAAAHRANHDLDAAWQTATRAVEIARQIRTHYRLYFALRNATDLALDRIDIDTARELLDELDDHAAAMDNDSGGEERGRAVAERRQRLAQLTAKP